MTATASQNAKSQRSFRLFKFVRVRLSRKLWGTYRVRLHSGVSRALGALLLGIGLPVWAGPTGGQVVSGQAQITAPTAQSTVVNQATPRAVINWKSFGIAGNESVQFVQPSSSSVVLNRIVGSDASKIYGSLTANGQVFLVNPQGVYFAPGARVDTGAMVASSLALSNADFASGKYRFGASGVGGGEVRNDGRISVTPGGYVVLAAPQVTNNGSVIANGGSVALLAGSRVTLDVAGDRLVSYSIDEAALRASVTNAGNIQANGGAVALIASTLDGALATAVNHSGVIRANSVAEHNGVVTLRATGGDTVVTGAIDVSGAGAGQTGGSVQVLGDRVGLFYHAAIDASGAAGGGTVLVGGGFQGKGDVPTSSQTVVGPNASITADATSVGKGGTVIVWADDTTSFNGSIQARGGVAGGDGGFVETSGKLGLSISTGRVNASASKGKAGTWLLDPRDIDVIDGGPAGIADVDQFLTDPLVDRAIAPNTLNAAGTDIVLQAERDITFTDSVNLLTPGASLTAQAGRSITVSGASITTNNGAILLSAVDAAASLPDAAGTLVVNGLLNAGTAFVTLQSAGTAGIAVSGTVNAAGNTGSTTLTATSGAIALGAAVGNATGATVLTAASTITGTGLVSGSSVTLDSGTGVGTNLLRVNTAATTLAARSRASGGVFVNETNDVILNVLGASNSAAAGAAYDVTTGSTITVSGLVNTAGNTGSTTLTATTGNIVLGAAVGNATGNTTLTAAAGNITGTGLVSGDNVALDSATGVGTSLLRVNTAASTTAAGALAARSRTSGGVFVSEANAVTLANVATTPNGVATTVVNGAAGTNTYDVNSAVTAAGALTTGTGGVNIANTGDTNLTTLTPGISNIVLNGAVGNGVGNGTGDTALTSVGNITRTVAGTGLVSGDNVALDSATGVGTSLLRVNTAASTTAAGALAARSRTSGGVFVSEANAVTLANVATTPNGVATTVVNGAAGTNTYDVNSAVTAAGALTTGTGGVNIANTGDTNLTTLTPGISNIVLNGAVGNGVGNGTGDTALTSVGNITRTVAGTGLVSGDNVALDSATGVGTSLLRVNTAASTTAAGALAARSRTSGGVFVSEANAVTLANVATTPNGVATTVVNGAAGTNTYDVNSAVTAAGALTTGTGGVNIANTGDTNLTTLTPGISNIVLNGAVGNGVGNGTGDTALTSVGNITRTVAGTGLVSGDNVALDSATGVGTSLLRVNTAASTTAAGALAARSRTSGGVFVSEANAVTLANVATTPNGVATTVVNGAAGTNTYDVNSAVTAAGALTTGTGGVNIANTGDTNLTTLTPGISNIVLNGAVGNGVGNGTGDTALTSVGNITRTVAGTGLVSGDNVALDSATGVGTSLLRVNTAASTTAAGALAARSRTSGGVFVSEANAVTLANVATTPNGVATTVVNGAAGTNTYDVNSAVTAAGALTTGTGGVNIANTGDTNLTTLTPGISNIVLNGAVGNGVGNGTGDTALTSVGNITRTVAGTGLVSGDNVALDSATGVGTSLLRVNTAASTTAAGALAARSRTSGGVFVSEANAVTLANVATTPNGVATTVVNGAAGTNTYDVNSAVTAAGALTTGTGGVNIANTGDTNLTTLTPGISNIVLNGAVGNGVGNGTGDTALTSVGNITRTVAGTGLVSGDNVALDSATGVGTSLLRVNTAASTTAAGALAARSRTSGGVFVSEANAVTLANVATTPNGVATTVVNGAAGTNTYDVNSAVTAAGALTTGTGGVNIANTGDTNLTTLTPGISNIVLNGAVGNGVGNGTGDTALTSVGNITRTVAGTGLVSGDNVALDSATGVGTSLLRVNTAASTTAAGALAARSRTSGGVFVSEANAVTLANVATTPNGVATTVVNGAAGTNTYDVNSAVTAAGALTTGTGGVNIANTGDTNLTTLTPGISNIVLNGAVGNGVGNGTGDTALTSVGNITRTVAGTGLVSGDNVALDSATGVGTSLLRVNTAASTTAAGALAARSRTSGGVFVSEANAVTLANVATTPNGVATTVVNGAAGTNTYDVNSAVTAAGALTTGTGGVNIANTGDTNLTTLTPGISNIVLNGAVGNGVGNGTGDTALTSVGNITRTVAGTGLVSGDNVALDSATGVGTSLLRVNTAASTTAAGALAARSRTSGGVFVSEANAVTLANVATTPNGVATTVVNGAAGTNTYDVNSAVTAAGALTTGTGGVNIANTGDTNLTTLTPGISNIVLNGAVGNGVGNGTGDTALTSVGNITRTVAGTGLVSGDNVALDSATGVGTSLLRVNTAASTTAAGALAARSRTSGGVFVSEANAVTLANVATTPNGVATTVVNGAAGTNTYDVNSAVTAAGALTTGTGGVNIANTGDTNLTTLTPGISNIVLNGAVGNGVGNGTGDTALTSVGNITRTGAGTGLVSGDNVALDSATGVGTNLLRVNTAATTLAARSRTSGGVFVGEANAVTLASIGTVANGAAAAGAYDVTAVGNIVLSDVSASNGAVKLVAGGTLTLPATPIVTAADLELRSNGGVLNTSANLSGADVTLFGSGGVGLRHDVIASNLLVGSTNASINQTAGSLKLSPTGTTTVSAGNGDVTLNSASNDFGGAVGLSGGTTKITDANALTLGTLTVGDLVVTNTGALNLGSGSASSIVALSSGGPLSQTGALQVGGTTSVNAGVGSITLNHANDFQGAVSVTGAATQVTDINALTFGTLATGALTAINTGALSLGRGSSSSIVATSNGGPVSQVGALAVSGVTSLNAGAGAVALDQAGNKLTGAISSAGSGAVTIRNDSPTVLGVVGSPTGMASSLAVKSAGNVTQKGAAHVGGLVSVDAGTGDVTMNNSGNTVGSLATFSGKGLQFVTATDASVNVSSITDDASVSTGLKTITLYGDAFNGKTLSLISLPPSSGGWVLLSPPSTTPRRYLLGSSVTNLNVGPLTFNPTSIFKATSPGTVSVNNKILFSGYAQFTDLATAGATATLNEEERRAFERSAGVGRLNDGIALNSLTFEELIAPLPYKKFDAQLAPCAKEQAEGKDACDVKVAPPQKTQP